LDCSPPKPPDIKNTSADENALLWKISGKGLGQPSWLYGTIHMICAADRDQRFPEVGASDRQIKFT
jgi:hypothetical protein